MNNSTSNSQSGFSKSCQVCRRRFKTTISSVSLCLECQNTIADKKKSTKAHDTTSISSDYLQMLDSRIAELEHAAELSSASDLSGSSAANTPGSGQLARLGSVRPVVITPYRTDGSRLNSPRSPQRQQAASVVMERYLNDSTEPDSV